MTVLRSLLFMALLVPWTMLMGVMLTLSLPFPFPLRWRIAWVWRRGFMLLSRFILGIRHEVRGLENIPAGPAIVLAKHQSAWETVALQDYLPPVSFVLKRELLRIPFLGWGLAAARMIAIDRASGREALEQVLERGRARMAQGSWIIIFPEGTRVPPGEKRRYKPGGAFLAARSGAPVLPVAHNAGEVWPRNAWIKHPGLITVSFGPVIDPTGLSEAEINARVETWIEGEMRRISPHRYPAA